MPDVVTVASLNLHCGRDARGTPYPVGAAIAALDTDVVLVQENWRPVGSDSLIRKAAAEWGYGEPLELDFLPSTTLRALDVARRADQDESGGWGIAVLSRLPRRRHEAIWLGSARGDVGPRAALAVEVETPGGATLRVVGVHLTHRVVHGPAQLRRLVRALGDPRRQPTVIGGDLNMCRPTVGLARPYRPMPRGRTFPAAFPLAQIDHLLRGPGVEMTAGGVAPAVGSDHLAVRASVRIPAVTVRHG